MKKLFVVLLILLSILQSAHALGITPPVYDFAYAPGEKHKFNFNIRNDGAPTYINVTAKGSFAPAIHANTYYFFLKSGEAKDVTIELETPELKTPGKHITELFFTQVAPKRYGRPSELSAVVAVVGQLMTRVPFQQKHAEISLGTSNTKHGEKAYFTVSVANYGIEMINKASGMIRIADEKNSASATAPLTDLTNLGSLATCTMYAEIGTQSLRPGKYSATAIIDYDTLKASDTEEFKITDLAINILGITSPDVMQGQLAKVTATVESLWGEDINAFAQINLKDASGATVAEATTPTTNVPAFGNTALIAYINTNNVPAGSYTAEVTVNYAGKQASGTSQITINEKPQQKKYEFNYGYAILLLIIIVLAVMLLRKKHEK